MKYFIGDASEIPHMNVTVLEKQHWSLLHVAL